MAACPHLLTLWFLFVAGDRRFGKEIKLGIREFARRALEDKLLNERVMPVVSARSDGADETWFELSYRGFE